jgi:transposase, IS6 family
MLLSACVVAYRASSATSDQRRWASSLSVCDAELKQTGELSKACRCRPSLYINNIIEQDHRFTKKRIVASQWFRSVQGAVNTIQGYEAMHMIRKGQIRWLQKGDIAGQVRFVNRVSGQAA